MEHLAFYSFIAFFVFSSTAVRATNESRVDELAKLTSVQRSWWLSDNEILYHGRESSGIYDSLTGNLTTVSNFIAYSSSDGLQSRHLRYTTRFEWRPDSFRRPDRKVFAAVIYDRIKGLNYTVADGEDIYNYKEAHGCAYSFVKDDDVYYVSSPGKEPIRVTNHSESGRIPTGWEFAYNWEFDDDIRGSLMFSPSDKYLAYASKRPNSSEKMLMTTYDRGSIYDFNYNMAYTKTGAEKIESVIVSMWSLDSNKSITMNVESRDNTSYPYLLRFAWVIIHGKELLVTARANRWQNEILLSLCDYEKATCSLIYEHKYAHGQWASPEDFASILHSNNSFFFILPKAIGDNTWQHIAKIEITTDHKLESISFIPSGEYDIRKIVAYRAEEDVIIYEAQAPNPWNMHVYGAPAGERSTLKEDRCLTCSLSNCTYQRKASVSPSKELKIDFSCHGPVPTYQVQISFNSTLHPIETKITAGAFSSNVIDYLSQWKTETFLLSSGFEAIVKIYEGDAALDSVPVTFDVYGGPDANQVTDAFKNTLGQKSARVYIDVRGSGGRGWKYRSAIYGRLVTVEVEDTLEAIQMVLAKYPKLDKKRVGVKGWSYGGTLTTALVELAPEGFFKCAYAGAPVTNFIYYGASYSERYMGNTPLSSYTDLTLNVTKFKHTNLLLVHGLRDDNVHFQNSALLIEALQQTDIQFELMVYPNQGHQIHLLHKIQQASKFFSDCYA